MNTISFQQARAAYAAKDYQTALGAYTSCLQDISCPLAPGEVGLLYHQIGNCLAKLKNHSEAIQAYTQATTDVAYEAVGTVNNNLGMSYAALHDYENAVRHFELAVSDAKYDTPYKAYSAMGTALLKLGKSAEAGVAFRSAALDEGNPDPTKALLNLGICFMALDRPADAVISYESALQFDMQPATKNKLFANLGQAYVATGQMQKAVTAFETALADKTYFLNDSANVDYQRAVGQVASGTADMTAVMSPVGADMSGLDVVADGVPGEAYTDPYAYNDPYAYQNTQMQPYGYTDPYANPNMAYVPDDRFFMASDEEIEMYSRGLAKKDRKSRNIGLKLLVVLVALLLIAFAAGVFLYTQGYGYPSQETVISELFANPTSAASDVFASDVSDERVDTMLSIITKDASASIDGMNVTMTETVAYVTATTEEGGSVTYELTLVRDLIGWKVSDVELYFASQN